MRTFNTTAVCLPDRHYMVDLTSRVAQIKKMVDAGQYFTINRARQYGKTTTLRQLRFGLTGDYSVVSLDFQKIGPSEFATEGGFVRSLCGLVVDGCDYSLWEVPDEALTQMRALAGQADPPALADLFRAFARWCATSPKPVVLMIDEVDSATNNEVFLAFLAQLRANYIDRADVPTFQSVILAGVTDVKNLKRKIRRDEDAKLNSPWNIAADFTVDMSFGVDDIAGMLAQYEADHGTGMDVGAVSRTIRDYTGGYPFLVSRICQLLDLDDELQWDERGVGEVCRRIVNEQNTLFESLMGKVRDNDRLRGMLRRILFAGETVSFNRDDTSISDAAMYGFVVADGGSTAVANRIFEMRLYNYFLSEAEYDAPREVRRASQMRDEYVRDGRLNMEHVLERYVEVFGDVYGGVDERFDEEEGRRRFLLFVRPIINGTGNYYLEARTRNNERMDLVIDYAGERFVVELKVWRGDAYNTRGEAQLANYLDYFRLQKGYMLSYCFNKHKHPGVVRVAVGDRLLVEAVV